MKIFLVSKFFIEILFCLVQILLTNSSNNLIFNNILDFTKKTNLSIVVIVIFNNKTKKDQILFNNIL